MTWLDLPANKPADTPNHKPITEFDSVLSLQPLLRDKYRRFLTQLWQNDALPHRITDLCRLCIAAIHGCQAELAWRAPQGFVTDIELLALTKQDMSGFSSQEKSALDVAQMVPHQHHSVSDAQVQRLQTAFGNSGSVLLLTACAFFDVNCRLKLSLDIASSITAAGAAEDIQPPLLHGAML